MRRREFLIVSTAMAAAACGSMVSTVAPSATTPLLTVLRSKGYVVTDHQNSYGGVFLIVNGKMPRFNIGGVLIGEDPKYSGDPTMNVANYPVPDGIEPTFA